MQHRREQKEVFAIYNRHFKPRVSSFFEFKRSVQPTETAAENEDTRLFAMLRNSSRSRRNAYRRPVYRFGLSENAVSDTATAEDPLAGSSFPLCYCQLRAQ